jgi:hypothetical protein
VAVQEVAVPKSIQELLAGLSMEEYINRCADLSEQHQVKEYGHKFETRPQTEIDAEHELLACKKQEILDALTEEDKEPWTVINTLPWPVSVDGVVHRIFPPIPACPVDCKWGVSFTISDVLWSIKDDVHLTANEVKPEGYLPYTPVPHLPKELAIEYVRLAQNQCWDGVTCVKGDGTLTPQLKLDINIQKARRDQNLFGMFENAERIAASRRTENYFSITDNHRAAAAVLFHQEIIDELPEWAKARPAS